MTPFTTKTLEEALTAKLMLNFGKTPEEATDQEILAEANKWELRHGGISGRTAQQFINYMSGTHGG